MAVCAILQLLYNRVDKVMECAINFLDATG